MKQAIWNGEIIAESDKTIVIEGNHYFPSNTIKKERLSALFIILTLLISSQS